MAQRLRRERGPNQPKRGKLRLAGFVIAGVLGAAAVFGLVLLALILHIAPPPVIHTDPAAAKRLKEELEKAQTAATGGTQEVVQADETELNSLLKEYVQASTATPTENSVGVIRDMKLSLTEDRMTLYVLANFRGRDLSCVLEGKLRTLNGYLDFEPTAGKIGSLPIPRASLKRAMRQMLATPESYRSMRLPTDLRDLHIENGKLVVVFK